MPQLQQPVPFNVLEALRQRFSIANPNGGPDPSIASRAEAANSLPYSVGAGSSDYDMRQQEQVRTDADRADAEQRGEVSAIRGAQQGALLRGFQTPQEEAAYQRKQEERKLEIPLETAKVTAATTLDRLLATQGAQDQRTEAQITSREKVANDRNIAASNAAGNAVPYQIGRDVTAARESYNSPWSNFIGRIGFHGAEDAYVNQLQTLLRRTGSLDMITKAAQQTISEGKTAEQALNEAQAAGVTLDPDEQDALKLFVKRMQAGR